MSTAILKQTLFLAAAVIVTAPVLRAQQAFFGPQAIDQGAAARSAKEAAEARSEVQALPQNPSGPSNLWIIVGATVLGASAVGAKSAKRRISTHRAKVVAL